MSIFVFLANAGQPTNLNDYQLSNQIDVISAHFLGKPYLENPLGEGHHGYYDQFPRFRFDYFDCQTYVETVMALALSHSSKEFKKHLDQIRYRNNSADFMDRNHFITTDWIPMNVKKGFIKPWVAPSMRGQVMTASTELPIRNWYLNLPLKRIRLKNTSTKIQQARLKELQNAGAQLKNINSSIDYIPLSTLSTSTTLVSEIPNGAILFIVRPLWLAKYAGELPLLVSHTGFAIWHDGNLFLRHASYRQQAIVDEPLLTYLQQENAVKPIGGISVYLVAS